MTRWTPQQAEAISDRGHNLLVAAAAGSGKTAVLVERIIQLVRQDRVDIDRMLIVTFTQAAAGEMRERISTMLLDAMQAEGSDQEHLREQVHLLNRASISTLHSFCMEVVRRYFHIIEISPSFRVSDATEANLLQLEVLEELFESEYERGDINFLQLVEMYAGGRDDAPLREMVRRTHEFVQSQPKPLVWLRERIEDFDQDQQAFAQSRWLQSIMDQLDKKLAGVEEIFRQAQQAAAQPNGPQCYMVALQTDLEQVQQLRVALQEGIFAFHRCLQTVTHKRLAPAPKGVDLLLKQEVQALREQGKKVLKDLNAKTLFLPPEQFLTDIRAMYPAMRCLGEVVEKYHHRYRDRKTEKNLVDFHDLEHYALEILAHPAIAEEYRHHFEYIFVDEYQDSNLVQDTLLKHIRRADNLFLVGDVKQSIYRFRLADPTLFLDKYQTYQPYPTGLDRRIDLSRNFRSRKPIIEGVNDIFHHIMSRQLGEMDYQPEAFLEYGLELPGDPEEALDTGWLELLLVDKAGSVDAVSNDEGWETTEEDWQLEAGGVEPAADETLEEEPGDVEFEARQLAIRIQEMHNQLFYDSKNQRLRPMEYRDMVVLMRATRGQAEIYFDTLMAAGIPVYADVDRGYFETSEMKVFINLLRLIDNKRQDIPLLSVMRSPIGRFTVNELIDIRINSSAPTYFEAVEEYLQAGDAPLASKLEGFIAQLNDWKEAARITPMDEMIWRLLLETGYLHYATAMPGGQQRQANLKILLERARQYQSTSMQGLFHFLRFIEKLADGAGDMGMAKILGESEDVVRIMSIHKSKGLEFPLVMVVGLGRKFNLNDIRARVLFHKDLGIGPRYVDPQLRVTRDTLARITLANRIKAENLAEEMRILYVACTRAREKLILVGTVNDLGKRIKHWAQGFNPFHLARAKSLLDWIGAVVLAHPDGVRLRQYGGIESANAHMPGSAYQWRLNIIERIGAEMTPLRQETGAGLNERLASLMADSEAGRREQLWQRLGWEYPHSDAIHIPSKIAVSQVKQMLAVGPEAIYTVGAVPSDRMPRFMMATGDRAEGGLRGAARGVVLHTVMQHLDFSRVETLAEIEEQIEALVARELLRAEEATEADRTGILDFFQSDLGKRVKRAARVEREVPFNLLYDAARIFPELSPDQEQLLLQGVIDLYFQEGEELVLIDYKSDRVKPSNRSQLIENYRVQVQLYRLALEKILGQKVKASYLYLFDSQEAVLID